MYNNYSQSNVLFWTLIARVALTQLNKAGFCESLEAPAQRTMVVICNFPPKIMMTKAELLQVGILFLIHLFAQEVLLIKKLEIEETKTT